MKHIFGHILISPDIPASCGMYRVYDETRSGNIHIGFIPFKNGMYETYEQFIYSVLYGDMYSDSECYMTAKTFVGKLPERFTKLEMEDFYERMIKTEEFIVPSPPHEIAIIGYIDTDPTPTYLTFQTVQGETLAEKNAKSRLTIPIVSEMYDKFLNTKTQII